MRKKTVIEHNRHAWPLLITFMAMMLSTFIAQQIEAATITVDQGGSCTLPDAIQAANTDTAVGGCPMGEGPDIVELETDVTLDADLPMVELTDPDNPSQSTLTINGNNHTIDGDHKFRGLGGCPRIAILSQIEAFLKNRHSHMFDITSIVFSK